MTQVTLVSYTVEAPRTATFSVGENIVTRPIAQEVTDDTLREHLTALARGLAIEYAEASPEVTPELSEGIVEAGTVLVEEGTDLSL